MINKVDGNSYYVYPKQKNLEIPNTGEKFNLDSGKNEAALGQKDKAEGGLSDKEKQEQLGVKLELSSQGQSANAERQRQAQKASEQSATGQKPLLETIQGFVAKAIAVVQDFFRRLWNDRPGPAAAQEAVELIEAADGLEAAEPTEAVDGMEAADIADSVEWAASGETSGAAGAAEPGERPETIRIVEMADVPEAGEDAALLDEETRNRRIQQSLRSGDIEKVMSLLTDNGRRTIAKNSTLLTSYDRNGRLVESGASDRQRILYGDKNTLKL